MNKIILLFLILRFSGISGHDSSCGNGEVYCFSHYDYRTCQIRTTNKEVIQEQIFECSQGDFPYLKIEIKAGGIVATLNLSLPGNIKYLKISNSFQTPCYIETSSENTNLTEMYFGKGEVFLNHNDFFTYFPNLEYFFANELGSEFMPFFTENMFLHVIDVEHSFIEQESDRVINETMLGGLFILRVFVWKYGGITKLMPNAFMDTTSLEILILTGNEIHELYDCTFDGLEDLRRMSFAHNDITTVEEYTFVGLNNLRFINLNYNPSFPLSTITLMKNIRTILLFHYNPSLLYPEIFQQFPRLRYLVLYFVTFNCTCETEWISQLESFGIYVVVDTYFECIGNPGFLADDPSLYVNCTNPSYPCFNHSMVCPGNNTWYRVDTENGCNCTYPPERAFYNDSSFVCSDIDECEDSSITCQGNCTNTLGSYICDCDEGFVNFNESFCNDVNECTANNGGCPQLCTNVPGSFICSCFNRFTMDGSGGCIDVNECDANNGGCPQLCTNVPGSFICSCFNGFTMDGSGGCIDVNECEVDNGGCEENCTNAIGTYECICFEGYSMQGLVCADIDECAVLNGNCLHNCNNSIGSFECSCFDGFVISSTNSSDCVLIDTGLRILNLGQTESSLVVSAGLLFVLIILSVLIVILLLFCFYMRRRLHVPKPEPATPKPTIAELDKIKESQSTIIQNPLYEPEGSL